MRGFLLFIMISIAVVYGCANVVYEQDADVPCMDASDKDACYDALAAEQNNPKYCGLITDPANTDLCYLNLAIENDGLYCPMTHDPDNCFWTTVVFTGRYDFCRNITDIETKDLCFFEYASEFEAAEQCDPIIHDKIRAVCLANVAKKTGDSGLCDRILDQENKEKCIAFVS